MPTELEVYFVKAIIRFLKQQIRILNQDAAESAEVAIQCLEAAFEIQSDPENSGDASVEQTIPGDGTPSEGAAGGQLQQQQQKNPIEQINLFDLFHTAVLDVTPARKEQAEQVKNEGNTLMRVGKYTEALLQYNRALALDATNPVVYCNRAAAHIRLSEYDKALADCRMALMYNPNYSKAHGRMGIALSNLSRYEEARQAYRRAIELEPDNVDFQNNLRVCEEQINRDQGGPAANLRQQLFQNMAAENPDLRGLISDMLNDPMISAASRQFVAQMLNEYPEFVSSFRQQVMNFAGSGNTGQPTVTGPNTAGTGDVQAPGGGGGGNTQANMDTLRELQRELYSNFSNLLGNLPQQQQQQNQGTGGGSTGGTFEQQQQQQQSETVQQSRNNEQLDNGNADEPKRD